MSLYALGVDFGTLSGRTVLVDLATCRMDPAVLLEVSRGDRKAGVGCQVPAPPRASRQVSAR